MAPAFLERLGLAGGGAVRSEGMGARISWHPKRHQALIRGENRPHGERPSPLARMFRLRGSIFPKAIAIAVPCAFVSVGLKLLEQHGTLSAGGWAPMRDAVLWTAFSSIVGWVLVFRTSQAYARFWDGCSSIYTMRAEWWDACSSIMAFCRHSKADRHEIRQFQVLLARLFSILHAVALAEIEDTDEDVRSEAFNFELLDPGGLDDTALRSLKYCDCKVQLLFQWIQGTVVENISSGVLSIPPPVLTRFFQEFGAGMVAFHQAMKISCIPFPFPYTQTCDVLLFMHLVLTPFMVLQWVDLAAWAGIFTFIQVFTLWSLNFITLEIENPFGSDDNDLDARQMQMDMNEHLLLLLAPEAQRMPQLRPEAELSHNAMLAQHRSSRADRMTCLSELWNQHELRGRAAPEPGSERPPARSGAAARGSLTASSTPAERASPATPGVDRSSPASLREPPRTGSGLEAPCLACGGTGCSLCRSVQLKQAPRKEGDGGLQEAQDEEASYPSGCPLPAPSEDGADSLSAARVSVEPAARSAADAEYELTPRLERPPQLFLSRVARAASGPASPLSAGAGPAPPRAASTSPPPERSVI